MTRVQAKTPAAARETGCRVIMMESPARMRREENTDSPAQTGRTHMEDRRHRAGRGRTEPMEARTGRTPAEDRRRRAGRDRTEPMAAQMARTPAEDRRFRADRVCPVLLPGENPAAGSP